MDLSARQLSRVLGTFGLVLLALLAACAENLAADAFVRNQTGQAVDVYQVVNGEEELVASLDKPLGGSDDQRLFIKSRRFPSGCTTGDLVARTPDGAEVARLTEPLCVNEGWLIETDGTSHKMP